PEYRHIHLTIPGLKRDLFAPYRVKNARKTSSNVFLKNSSSFSALFSLSGTKISSFETLLGFTAVREQKTEDGLPSPVSLLAGSVFTAENLRLL
ncbi:MAG: hypothetical protein IKH31_02305, partial [Clostridia bacterium]|nr:hypothetical protein [Clostridia bacterium]